MSYLDFEKLASLSPTEYQAARPYPHANPVGVLTPERRDLDYSLYMIYSKRYLQGLARYLNSRIVRIERDTDFGQFDNTVHLGRGQRAAGRVVRIANRE